MFRRAKETRGDRGSSLVPVIAILIVVVIGLSPAAAERASAQHDPRIDPAPAYVIRGATVHTLAGETIENGVVVLRDGRIAEVGTGLANPAGAAVIDATGLHVYPGMIDAFRIPRYTPLASISPWRGRTV